MPSAPTAPFSTEKATTMTAEPEDAEQQDEGDLDTGEDPYPSPAATERDIAKLEIDVREDPFQVAAIVQKIDRKRLVLSPDFQRKEVWKQKQRSEFIESILLNYPLPPLYFNQDKSGRYIVVDGLQRSSSIYRFIKNEYPLMGLERLKWLNGQRFQELDPALQARIEDRKLNCYVLKPSVPMGVVQDIFARINRGGMPLNRQEIRHGLYQGKSTELLKRLAGMPAFSQWIGRRLTPQRMRNEEAALRCIAFSLADPEKDYKDNMDKFLESAMLQLNDAADSMIETIARTFQRVFEAAKEILGEDAFRIPTSIGRGMINLAVMESVYRFFASKPDDWLKKNARKISQNYQRLLGTAEFLSAVRQSTGDTAKVRARFHLAEEILGRRCAD
jgi:hypothetical protein